MLISPFSASTEANPSGYGPRLDELTVYFYENGTACYNALKSGEVDYMAWELSHEQYEDALADQNIVVGAQKSFVMFEFDLNNNYTIFSRPDHRSPTNDLSFRRVLCYLTDKDHIAGEILGAFGERIDVPISAPQSGWWNQMLLDLTTPTSSTFLKRKSYWMQVAGKTQTTTALGTIQRVGMESRSVQTLIP